MNSARFRQAMQSYASGVSIVACGTGADRQGMTVSSVASVSADPPMILVCLNRAAACHGALTTAPRFSVNILRAEDAELARVFAGQTGVTGGERFCHGDWSGADTPVLGSAMQTLICDPVARQEAGSHTVLIGAVTDLRGPGTGEAMVSFAGDLHALGRGEDDGRTRPG